MLSLLLAFATAFPSFARLLEGAAAEIKRQRTAATHDQIDAAVDAAQAAPWVCPARCPLHALGVHDTGTASAAVPKTP